MANQTLAVPRLRFLDLPGELRNLIYDSVIENLPDTIRIEDLQNSPALAHTNKQIRHEFLSRLFHRKFVDITSTSSLWALESFFFYTPTRPFALDMISHIRLSDFLDLASSPARATEIFDACSWIPNLRSLQLILLLDPVKLPIICHPDMTCKRIVGTIVEAYRLDALAKMQQLRFLSVICVLEGGEVEKEDAVALVEELGRWMEDCLRGVEGVQGIEGSISVSVDGRRGVLGFGIRRRELENFGL